MNVAVLSERHVERFGTYEAVFFGDEVRTNAEQLERGARAAGALVELGVQPGDRVAVLLPNSLEVPVAYSAILRCGGVIVPILFLLAPAEIAHILADAEPRAIFTSPEFLPNVRAALAELASPPVVILTGKTDGDVLGLDGLIAADPLPLVERQPDDIAVISYTSGTTGRPKGVMLSHGNMLFNAENTARVAPMRDGDVALSCLPLAHLFGIGNALVSTLFKLKGVVLDWFTCEGVFSAVREHRVTSTALVPAMIQLMLADPGFDEVDWSVLRYAAVGAAPVPAEMTAEFERRTGARLLQGYGLTETSPVVAVQQMEDGSPPGSCGRPVPGVEVMIVGEDGSSVPPGDDGEVCVRGPNVMLGYYGMPDETAEVLRDGFFHTGDVGHMDAEGFLSITDRLKDLIIRGGLNIYPRDIEEVIHAHSDVLEAAVIGVPDPMLGEVVGAFVAPRPGATLSPEDITAHCRESLAPYKTPAHVWLVEALPRNAVGKVLKTTLREHVRERVRPS